MKSFALHIQQSIEVVFLTLFTHSYTLQKLVSQPMQHSNHYILYIPTPSRVFNKFNRFNQLNRFNCTISTTHLDRIVIPLPTACIPLHPLGAKHMEPEGARRSQKEPEGARTVQPLQSLFPPSPVTLADRWLFVTLAGRHSQLIGTQAVTLAATLSH